MTTYQKIISAQTILFFLILISCSNNIDGKFGRKYNQIRLTYGSPVIHPYMELKINNDSFQYWETPRALQDTIQVGYHAEKGFYIQPDSVLQEDDIFRYRLSDSTFAFVGILTRGNKHKSRFNSIYYDTICAKSIQLSNGKECIRYNNTRQITIQEADSILASWHTSRLK